MEEGERGRGRGERREREGGTEVKNEELRRVSVCGMPTTNSLAVQGISGRRKKKV